jgi:hypothetical protein
MAYYFSNPTYFLAGWVRFGAGLWVGPNKSICYIGILLLLPLLLCLQVV